MMYTDNQKINGELAVRTLSAQAQKGYAYAANDLITVYEVERDDYEDEDGWHTKKTYDVTSCIAKPIVNMTIEELDKYLSGWNFEDDDEDVKYWYAVQMDEDDNDWGTGSFDYDEAYAMAKRMGGKYVLKIADGKCPTCEEIIEVE